MSLLDEVKIQEAKRRLATFVEEGRLDESLVDLLVSQEGRCLPIECEVLDYKQCLGDDKFSYAKAVLQIVSLYNSFGGYLIYGVVEEESEVSFRVAGVGVKTIDVERLKALIKEYTGERLQIAMAEFQLAHLGSSLTVVYIPQRVDAMPLEFHREGPQDSKNRPVFRKGDIWFRKGDECLLAKGREVFQLAARRICPILNSGPQIETLAASKTRLENNLPDRNFICPKFVGRQDLIDRLWRWFADDLSHVRVLAGEGGLGKTSVAYQFAEEICGSGDIAIERVVWLTAKREQFAGVMDSVVSVPETHYSSYEELLKVMSRSLGYLEEELEDASEKSLQRMLQQGSQLLSTFFVIDDVDSLTPAEQRKVLELGFLFAGNNKSRLLMTTRVNQSYSEDIAIQIKGFALEEYRGYLGTLFARYGYVDIDERSIPKMHECTGGSPLFTESLFRLVRYIPLEKAISEWRGGKGESVRAAALEREVNQLSAEAKRVLLAATHLRECSLSELVEVAGYVSELISERVLELSSLYLVSAPRFTDEPRFLVNNTTRRYVLDNAATIAPDHVRIEQRAKKLRQTAKALRATRQNPIIGAAISEAVAHLKRSAVNEARQTIAAAAKRFKNHPDLLTAEAKCLLCLEPPNYAEAARVAQEAVRYGAKKPLVFHIWYESEWGRKHYSGAIAAIDSWARINGELELEWLLRRAAAVWYVAVDQEISGNLDRALADYTACDSDLARAAELATESEKRDIRAKRFDVHNAIWKLISKRAERGVDSAVIAMQELKKMVEGGDYRVPIYLRMVEVLEWLNDHLSQETKPIVPSLRNLVEQRFRLVRTELEKRFAADSRGEFVLQKMLSAEHRYREIAERRGFQ